MVLEIDAIYDHGVLKLARELPLPEGEKVRVTIHSSGGATQRLAGLIPWTGSPEELDRYLADPDEGVVGHEV